MSQTLAMSDRNQLLGTPRSFSASHLIPTSRPPMSHYEDILEEYADEDEPQPRNSEVSLHHVIFKVCIRCSFNTKDDAERSRTAGPSFFCPKCEAPSFMIACTLCRFESSVDCPLTELLLKRPKEKFPCHDEGKCPERDSGGPSRADNKSPNRPKIPRRSRSVEMKESGDERAAESKKTRPEMTKLSSSDVVKRYKASREMQKLDRKLPQRNPTPVSQEPEDEVDVTLSDHTEFLEDRRLEESHSKLQRRTVAPLEPPDPPSAIEIPPPAEILQSFCSQCTQPHCTSCSPGYMNMVVDMKEFSVTFASDIKLCTMCEHWLCPKSLLEVVFRCRGCGHERCDNCGVKEDEFGEEWCICCKCPREDIRRIESQV